MRTSFQTSTAWRRLRERKQKAQKSSLPLKRTIQTKLVVRVKVEKSMEVL